MDLKKLNRIEKIKKLIEKGYSELEKISEEYIRNYGEKDFVFELPEPDEEGHKFIRISITDNLKKFQEEGRLFTATSFKKYDLKISRLKRKPKENA